MHKASIKLLLALSTLILSCVLLRVNGWFGLGALIGFVLSILYWFDTARELREAPQASRALRIVGGLMAVPQALFGLLCATIGLGIIVWVLYNTFVERQPQYTGGFLTLGMGPSLVLFGCGWLVSAFRRGSDRPDGA